VKKVATQDLTPYTFSGMPSDLLVTAGRALELRTASPLWLSWTLTPRQICDLELLTNGAFAPLQGFMTRRQHEAVCGGMRLDTGELWPIPVTLDVPGDVASRIGPGDTIALRDAEGVMLAVLHVEDVWQPDAVAEAEQVFGTESLEHPGVAELLQRTHAWRVGGRVEGVQLPVHHDYAALRPTPEVLRREFSDRGWSRVVAFQTRNPMHRAHVELTLRAAREARAHLLLHPVVGLTKAGDVDHHTRVRCYRAVVDAYPPGLARLALLPLAMRMAGPREAVWHALIRRNYGCTHLVVGRDHAGPGTDSSGRPFYGPYEAQELLRRHEREIGVVMVPFRDMLYARTSIATYPRTRSPPACASFHSPARS
jgi:sulfate adenylyltransferase